MLLFFNHEPLILEWVVQITYINFLYPSLNTFKKLYYFCSGIGQDLILKLNVSM